MLRLIASGYSNKEIAGRLSLSVKTVEAHKANAMRKLESARPDRHRQIRRPPRLAAKYVIARLRTPRNLAGYGVASPKEDDR